MSKEENIPKTADSSLDDWSEVDSGLGQALVRTLAADVMRMSSTTK